MLAVIKEFVLYPCGAADLWKMGGKIFAIHKTFDAINFVAVFVCD